MLASELEAVRSKLQGYAARIATLETDLAQAQQALQALQREEDGLVSALSALLLYALPAFAAEKIELWNGDIRKGSVSVRMNGTLREMAVDEVVSALGFAPKNGPPGAIFSEISPTR